MLADGAQLVEVLAAKEYEAEAQRRLDPGRPVILHCYCPHIHTPAGRGRRGEVSP